MYFLIRIISSAVIGAALGYWISIKVNFIPRRLKRKYYFLMETIYSVAYTIIVTLLDLTNIDLSWMTLIALSLFIWVVSAKLINAIAQYRKENLQRDTPASSSA